MSMTDGGGLAKEDAKSSPRNRQLFDLSLPGRDVLPQN